MIRPIWSPNSVSPEADPDCSSASAERCTGVMRVRPSESGIDAASADSSRRTRDRRLPHAPHALDEILRESDAHEIPGAILRESGMHDVENAIRVRLGFADGETAYREAAPVMHPRDRLRGLGSQILVNAALHDRKQRLLGAVRRRGLTEGVEAARQPANAALARVARRGCVALSGND